MERVEVKTTESAELPVVVDRSARDNSLVKIHDGRKWQRGVTIIVSIAAALAIIVGVLGIVGSMNHQLATKLNMTRGRAILASGVLFGGGMVLAIASGFYYCHISEKKKIA